MINWTELFTLQKELDDRIVEEHGLQNVDLIPKRVVAFLVELSEFANEARFFKFWSKDQRPRRIGVVSWEDRLLNEFVDAVHFAIGIGLELGFHSFKSKLVEEYVSGSLEDLYIFTCSSAVNVNATYYLVDGTAERAGEDFECMLEGLLAMGKKLGITDEEIVAAYKAKHAENHRRQDRGY